MIIKEYIVLQWTNYSAPNAPNSMHHVNQYTINLNDAGWVPQPTVDTGRQSPVTAKYPVSTLLTTVNFKQLKHLEPIAKGKN